MLGGIGAVLWHTTSLYLALGVSDVCDGAVCCVDVCMHGHCFIYKTERKPLLV